MTSKPQDQQPASLQKIAVVGGLGAAAIICSALAGIALWNIAIWLDNVIF